MQLFYIFSSLILILILLFLYIYYKDAIKKKSVKILLFSLFPILLILQYVLHFSIPIKLGGTTFHFHLSIYPIIFILISYLIVGKTSNNNFILHLIISFEMPLCEMITFAFFFIVCGIPINELNDYKSIYYFTDYYYLFYMLLIIIFISFTNAFFYYKNKINIFYTFLLAGTLSTIIIILSSILIHFIIHYIFSNKYAFFNYTLGMIFVIFITIISCLLLFIVIYKLIKSHKEINELKLQQLNNVYNNILSSSFEEMMKIKHDIANILEVCKKYNMNISNELINRFGQIDSVKFCSNEILNQILVIKIKEAKDNDIIVEYNINCKTDNILIADIDLISLITNLFDNALEATIMAKEKSFIFQVNIDENLFYIHMKNKIPQKNFEHSIKYKNKKYHGYGKKIISDILLKYKGEKEEFKNNFEYVIDITIPNK